MTTVTTPERKCFYILVDDAQRLYHVDERFLPSDWIKDHSFKNAKEMSAWLRDTLGYTWACEVLFKCEVPKDHGLWGLNHTGYPKNDEFLLLLNELTVE